MKHKTFSYNKYFKTFFRLHASCFIIIASLFILHAERVSAQEVGLSLTPPLVKLIIKPGKSVVVGFRLQNTGDPAIVNSYVRGFKPIGNLGAVQIKREFDGPIQFNLENYDLELNEAFFLKSRDNQQLLLKITVPENTTEGDYYYSFLNQTKAGSSDTGATVSNVSATIGANILITVTKTGERQTKGRIYQFELLPHYRLSLFGGKLNFYESIDEIKTKLIVANEGANTITPSGSIQLIGNFGERATFTIPPQNVLAYSERLLIATPSTNTAKRDESVSFSIKGFFLGRYRLNASLDLGDGTTTVFASTHFYAFPFKLIIALIFVGSVTFFIVKRIRNDH